MALPAQAVEQAGGIETGQLVKVASKIGEMGGIVLAIDAGEALVKAYDRTAGVWVTNWWPLSKVAPMVTGMTAAESREVARTLLEQGKLPLYEQMARRATKAAYRA